MFYFPNKNSQNSIHQEWKEQDEALQELSLSSSGHNIIPLTAKTPNEYKPYTISGKQGQYNPSKASIKQHFPFEIEYAMTVHKAQGRTISNVVLALCERPTHCLQMKLASIFVSFSRVKFADSIRLLLHSDGMLSIPSYKRLKYITKLSLSLSIAAFHAGFENNNGICQLDKALKFYFEEALAD